MLAWSEGTDNGRQKTRNHGYDVIVGGELFTDYSDHPRKLVTLNPKLKSTGAGRYQLLPVGGMPTASSLAWKTSLRKVRTLWHCSRLRSVAFTYDWSWWYPSGNRPLQQYLGFTAGRWLVISSSIRLTAWLQNSKKRAERSGEIDVWAESPRLSPLWLSASSSACHGLLIITVITPLPTKPSATKMPENWSWRTRQLPDMQMRQRDVAALDAKYTKELADAKLKMMLCVMMLRWSSSVAHQSSLSVSAWSHHASAWICSLSPTGRHRWTGINFTLRERLITMQKQLEGTQKYINEQCR